MGGRAFNHVLAATAFPRMSPEVYRNLKTFCQEKLSPLFKTVLVPREAPGKDSYGDVDLIAHGPKGPESTSREHLQKVLGAEHVVKEEAFSFALPAHEGPLGVYRQVDLRVCTDEATFGRFVFANSDGDLGMILGIVARTHGLSLGSKGLKLAHHETINEIDYPEFTLSQSIPDILGFFHLDYATWDKGFASTHDIFTWIATSRFYHPPSLTKPDTPGRERDRSDRPMYQAFLQFSRDAAGSGKWDAVEEMRKEEVVEEAIVAFGKTDEYESLKKDKERRLKIRQALDGRKIIEWTGIQEGSLVGRIKKVFMERVSTDRLLEMTEGEVAATVKQIHEELGSSDPIEKET